MVVEVVGEGLVTVGVSNRVLVSSRCVWSCPSHDGRDMNGIRS